jgi:hypothetical protein
MALATTLLRDALCIKSPRLNVYINYIATTGRFESPLIIPLGVSHFVVGPTAALLDRFQRYRLKPHA